MMCYDKGSKKREKREQKLVVEIRRWYERRLVSASDSHKLRESVMDLIHSFEIVAHIVRS